MNTSSPVVVLLLLTVTGLVVAAPASAAAIDGEGHLANDANGHSETLTSATELDRAASDDVEDDSIADSDDPDGETVDDSGDLLDDSNGDTENETDTEEDLLEDAEESTIGTVDDADGTLEGPDETVDGLDETTGDATELSTVPRIVADTGVVVGANESVLETDLEAGAEGATNETDDETASADSTDGGWDDRRAEAASEPDDDDGPVGSIPGGTAGAGVAAGAGASGLALLARRVGTATALGSGQGTGTAGSTLSSILSAVRGWGWRVLALLGYRRFSDDDPLEHDGRRKLYEYIQSSPGSYLSEISEETDVPLQSARYHLRILEFENLIESERIGGRRRYAPVGVDSAELEAALNDDATASVLRALADEGPSSVSELAETLDRDPSTISHHLNRLEDEGLVEREREGRSVVNRIPDDVERSLGRRAPDEITAGPPSVASRP